MLVGNILGEHRVADYRAIPRCVYTTPSVCCVGVTPGQAAAAGIQLRMVGHDLAETARAAVVHAFLTYGEAIERSLRELAVGAPEGR